MGHRRRFAFSPGQKILLWVSGLLCLWQIIQIPAIFDPILDFYAAGIVPGTSIVLAPDTVLHFLLAFLVSCITVICYWQFGRRSRRRIQTTTVAASPESATVTSPVTKRIGVPHMQQRTLAVRDEVVRYVNCAFVYMRSSMARLHGSAIRSWRWLRPHAVRAGHVGMAVLGRIGNALVAVVIWILAVESALAIWTWQYMEPHIRHFDRWLERRVNANPYGARVVHVVRGIARMATNAKERAIARSEGARK